MSGPDVSPNPAAADGGPRHLFLVLLLGWLAMAVLINPLGDFPLNDAWQYGGAVKTLLEEGRLEVCDYTYSVQVLHILWGWLVSQAFGFSYTALRLSVIGIGFAGVLAVWALLRECGASRRHAFLGALLLAVNPIYVNLACTFMTDVPFTALASLSLWLLIRGARRDSLPLIAAGVAAAAGATLIRQLGLVIPTAFAAGLAVRYRFRPRALLIGFASCVAVAAILWGYHAFYASICGPALGQNARERELLGLLMDKPAATLLALLEETLISSCYLGLFLLPLLAAAALPADAEPRRCRGRLAAAFAATGVLFALLACRGKWMPLYDAHGNIIHDLGLGPTPLRDAWIDVSHALPKAPSEIWILLTVLGCLGVGLALSRLLAAFARPRPDAPSPGGEPPWIAVTALCAGALYFLPLGMTGLFDRYLLLFLPLGGVLVLLPLRGETPRLPPLRKAAAVTLYALFAAFSVMGTHDYLAWNRARWDVLDHLTDNLDIPPSRIDGGFEFSGVHLYDPSYEGRDYISWWWVKDDDYLVGFTAVGGTRIVRMAPYTRWLPPGRHHMYAVERVAAGGNPLEVALAYTKSHHGENLITSPSEIVRYWHGNGSKAPANVSHGWSAALPAGRHRAVFSYAAAKPRRDIRGNWGFFGLVRKEDSAPLAEEEIPRGADALPRYRTHAIEFSLSEPAEVEVRVTAGDAELWLKDVRFVPVEPD